jgi:hypothetical protein
MTCASTARTPNRMCEDPAMARTHGMTCARPGGMCEPECKGGVQTQMEVGARMGGSSESDWGALGAWKMNVERGKWWKKAKRDTSPARDPAVRGAASTYRTCLRPPHTPPPARRLWGSLEPLRPGSHVRMEK